jgi:hypothetical protein
MVTFYQQKCGFAWFNVNHPGMARPKIRNFGMMIMIEENIGKYGENKT